MGNSSEHSKEFKLEAVRACYRAGINREGRGRTSERLGIHPSMRHTRKRMLVVIALRIPATTGSSLTTSGARQRECRMRCYYRRADAVRARLRGASLLVAGRSAGGELFARRKKKSGSTQGSEPHHLRQRQSAESLARAQTHSVRPLSTDESSSVLPQDCSARQAKQIGPEVTSKTPASCRGMQPIAVLSLH